MNGRIRRIGASVVVAAIAAWSMAATSLAGASTPVAQKTIPFETAKMIIEVNGTAGDAGLQISADAEPWRKFEVFRPDGRRIVNFRVENNLRNFGLTELFMESSEPPFTKFPLDKFKNLFPAGS